MAFQKRRGRILRILVSDLSPFAVPFALPLSTVPLTTIPLCLLMVSVHPQPLDDCPCFEDAIAFIAVSMGIAIGRWSNIRWGLIEIEDHPLNYSQKPSALFKSSKQTIFEPLLESITSTSSSATSFLPDSLIYLFKSITMMVLGIIAIFLVRIVTKTLCKLILPKLLRYASSTFGLVLPRRHYVESIKYEKIPMDLHGMRDAVPSVLELDLNDLKTRSGEEEELGEPENRREGSGNGNGNGFSTNDSNPTSPTFNFNNSSNLPEFLNISRPSSPSFLQNLSPPTSRPTSPIPRNLSPSPSQLLRDSHSHKIKFATQLTGGRNLPIPFTAPDSSTMFPDHQMSMKLVEKLSKEEEQRSKDPNWSQDDGVKHFDADVLTKVVVYSMIGLFASSFLPYLFCKLGLKS